MNLKLGHPPKDSVEVIDVQGEIDMYMAPRLRELLIALVGNGSYQLVTAAGMGDSVAMAGADSGPGTGSGWDVALSFAAAQQPHRRPWRGRRGG